MIHPPDTAHAGWGHRLWTEAEVAACFPQGLRNQAAFDAAGNFGEKADILRYEVRDVPCRD